MAARSGRLPLFVRLPETCPAVLNRYVPGPEWGECMYSNKPIIYKEEKRKKPDFICSWLEISTALVWFILFMIILLFQKAQPREKTFFDRLFAVELQDTLNYSYLTPIIYLLMLLLVLSTVSLLLNLKRLKRRTDHLRISYIISLVFTAAGLVFFLIRF